MTNERKSICDKLIEKLNMIESVKSNRSQFNDYEDEDGSVETYRVQDPSFRNESLNSIAHDLDDLINKNSTSVDYEVRKYMDQMVLITYMQEKKTLSVGLIHVVKLNLV